jgi:hypothetical protein
VRQTKDEERESRSELAGGQDRAASKPVAEATEQWSRDELAEWKSRQEKADLKVA